jgi:hypothetical protein
LQMSQPTAHTHMGESMWRGSSWGKLVLFTSTENYLHIRSTTATRYEAGFEENFSKLNWHLYNSESLLSHIQYLSSE